LAAKLEDVFKVSGVPTFTFVEPKDFRALLVALRSRGRGVVVEGPSGIGKSTAVDRALAELGMSDVTRLSARVPADVDYIALLPEIVGGFGVVVIDDFHRLPHTLREQIADLLKALADREETHSKLVIIGINDAGKSLIQSAPDLANRIDVIEMETESPDKIDQLLSLGERELNVHIQARDQVVEGSNGSFYIAQLLGRDLCMKAGVLETATSLSEVKTSYSEVRAGVLSRQEARFGTALRNFARGTKFRPSGRAPYLRLLRWLAESGEWSISLIDEIAAHPQDRPSIIVVIEQGYLETLASKEDIAQILHYDRDTKTLSIEDPHLAYVLRNQDWVAFVRSCGFTKVDFATEYDVALSFAGEDREFAERLFYSLQDRGLTAFYDRNEQHRILAEDVELYLAPVYQNGSTFVVAVLGETYGSKRWTLFESSVFGDRIDRHEVIPVWSTKAPVGAFDKTRDIGGMQFDPDADLALQAEFIAEAISRKLAN
jgi:hypothetical protein